MTEQRLADQMRAWNWAHEVVQKCLELTKSGSIQAPRTYLAYALMAHCVATLAQAQEVRCDQVLNWVRNIWEQQERKLAAESQRPSAHLSSSRLN